MISIANVHHLLRFLGIAGLFLVILNNSDRFQSELLDTKFTPYIIILSVMLISLGLYLKLKYAEEEPSTVTYVVTFITLLTSLAIGGTLLFSTLLG